MPDYDAWALFAAVADHGSFRAAAAANGVSVPTVSKAVARLEARFGLSLFHRTSRRLSLTAAGAGLADRARAIVAQAEEAEEAARQDAVGLVGPIRMTAPMSFGMACLGPILADFCRAHPGISLDLVLSDARCDLIAEGIDLALRIADLPDSSLISQTICPVPMVIVASPDYLAAAGTPGDARELRNHAVFGYGHDQRDGSFVLIGPDGERSVVQPTGPLFVNNGEIMLPMLIAGLGIAILPRFIAGRAIDSGQLATIMPQWSPAEVSLHLVTPPSRRRPARVSELARALVAALRRPAALAPN